MVSKRYTILHEDGEVKTARKPKLVQHAGKPWAIINGEKYHVTGRWHHFYYRTWISFFTRKQMGLQKIWIQGNPTPLFFGGGVKHELFANLNDTARAIYNMTEYDNVEKLLKPRKADLLLLILVGAAALGIGTMIGGRI
jgi:hypothetical protein